MSWGKGDMSWAKGDMSWGKGDMSWGKGGPDPTSWGKGGKDPWGGKGDMSWGKGGKDAWGGGAMGGWGMDPWSMGGKGMMGDWGKSGKDMMGGKGMMGGKDMMGVKGMMGGKGMSMGSKGGKSGATPTKKVFIGALKKEIDEETLRAWAECFGETEEVKILVDEEGLSKGYGFATFKDIAAANQVYANYEKNEIEGNWIDCQPSKGTSEKPGDWYCGMCGELVFAKRDACNNCGYAGPMRHYVWGGKSKPKSAQAPAGPASPQVEAFITSNGLDEKAARCLRELPPHQQKFVTRKPLQAENPSSALMMRVKKARESAPY